MMQIEQLIAQMTPGGYGIWTGVGMFAYWMFREWRLTRKLSLDDRLARRDGYAAQVTSLQAENRELRREMDERDRQHRNEIRGLQDKLSGMRAASAAEQQAQLNKMDRDQVPPATAKRFLGEGK